MYNPPKRDSNPKYSHCVEYSTNIWSDSYKEAYDAGYLAASEGKNEEENPYKLSHHERDTTYSDECNYYWWRGFSDFKES